MSKSGNIVHIGWRGAAGATNGAGLALDGGEDSARGRVLLLVEPGGNRERLREHLQGHYEVVPPTETHASVETFDLAIVDTASFHRWQRHLVEAKERESPTFLPVILIVSRRDLQQRLKAFWDVVDEFIVTPIDRQEFAERIAMLLRVRHLALAQRSHLAYLVNHDRTTGLPNKNLFLDRLNNAVRDAAVLDRQLQVTVIHIPLSRVLKSLGHHGLERAAGACSSRLRSLLGDNVSLARLTTEEWGLIHGPNTSTEPVFEACRKIQQLGETPLEIGGERLHIAARIGIGIYPDDAADGAATLDCAMSALSEAQDAAPVFYSRDTQRRALRFIRTEARLREALEQDQLEVWFQPQLRLADHQLVGVETLVRWRLPGGELVSPGEFIPVAEATGLIRDVDRWVLENACAALQGWRLDGIEVGQVSVNASAEEIQAVSFVEGVRDALARHDLPPGALELELTETALFETNSREGLAALEELREAGIRIAVDDFGTGYSSLTYLHRLPITTLKIDKAFVDDVDRNANNAAITRTILWLAKNFGLETVAEGIETEAQADYLRSLGVGVGQGFLYARPMPDAELRRWIDAQRSS